MTIWWACKTWFMLLCVVMSMKFLSGVGVIQKHYSLPCITTTPKLYPAVLQQDKEVVRLLFILYYAHLFSLCLSVSNFFPLSFLSLFSYLTEGCRILQSGWWSSNSIYSTAQRQTERAGEIVRERGRGMETTDVREHFLLAEEREAL